VELKDPKRIGQPFEERIFLAGGGEFNREIVTIRSYEADLFDRIFVYLSTGRFYQYL
jgi:hypothetical protein